MTPIPPTTKAMARTEIRRRRQLRGDEEPAFPPAPHHLRIPGNRTRRACRSSMKPRRVVRSVMSYRLSSMGRPPNSAYRPLGLTATADPPGDVPHEDQHQADG